VEQATKNHAGYGGDRNLGRLLERSGSRLGAARVRRLLAGVVAAPEPFEAEAWTVLVAADAGDELLNQLRALHAEMAAVASGETLPREKRLAALRAELRRRRLHGFIVPRRDEHLGEYVPARAERLAWLTGFTGSAGMAMVLRDTAAVFVDGRYTLQVRDQVDGDTYSMRHLVEEPASGWIAENLPPKARLGYDPWLHTASEVAGLAAACRKAGGRLVAVADNPVDAVWTDQPPPPISPMVPHPVEFAGKEAADKRREVAEGLAAEKVDAAVLTAPDSIAWLLNVRGGDVPFTPLPLGFAIVFADSRVDLFVNGEKLAPGLPQHLGNRVRIADADAFGQTLDRLGTEGRTVRVDPDGAPAWTLDRLRKAGATVSAGADPCALPRARKNAVELDGTRAAHRRDGAALSRFLAWFAEAAPAGGLTEIAAADRLEAMRRDNALFRGLSFPTISAAGANGAICHYRVTDESNRRIEPGSLYLVDSGGQYLDGTTDVTRTVAVGTPSPEMRERFTLVLKGHIALATARFPEGTTGSQLDTLARMALWRAGLDYDHGTGHGVGSFLGVHEGPHRISKMPNRTPLEPGMMVSNEPGYYKAGAYGIRIENLVAVTAADGSMLGFETLTLAPIDLTLVEPALLDAEERAWLDAYHARVREVLVPLVDSETAAWLERATRPVS
jgi:Xaa-Pro aminopeptidase